MFVKSVWLDTEGHHRVILDGQMHNLKGQKKAGAAAKSNNIRRTNSERSIAATKDYQMLQCIGLSETNKGRDMLGKKVAGRKSSDIKLRKQSKKGGYKGIEVAQEKVVEFVETVQEEKPERNQLTERVLQWLDKSGKNTMIKDVFLEDVDDLLKKSAEYSQYKRKLAPLRRSESVHHLHLTFNDDDYIPDPYVSRCKSAALDQYQRPLLKKSTSHGESNRNKVPSPPSLVVHMANLELNSAESSSAATSSASPPPPPRVSGGGGTQRKNRKLLKRKDTLMENQYKHLIHKHILETTCNTQIVKRQLHIFIPKLKKQLQEGGSTTTNAASEEQVVQEITTLGSVVSEV